MNIQDITIGQLQELRELHLSIPNSMPAHPYEVNASYFIFTVTNYFTGKLVAVYEHELVLSQASWIPDTGRLSESLKTGKFNEVEQMPEQSLIINRGSIVNATKVTFQLPVQTK